MSLRWNADNCEAQKIADALPSDEREAYYEMRHALIWAIAAVKFPAKSESWGITEDNWQELFLRLNMLERADCAYRQTAYDPANVSRDIYFTPGEVQSMIGLEVNAGTSSAQEFNAFIIRQLKDNAQRTLEGWQPE